MTKIAEKDLKNIWHPFTQQWELEENLVIEKAKGAYIYTEDGRAILDAVSSWWVNLYGHANPIIADAISKQAHELEHVIFAGFTHKPAVELSEKLLPILPGKQTKMFFSDNGSTSVEVALKMAFQYWHNQNNIKTKVIAISGSYHGDTFGAMAVAERNAFSEPFDALLFDVEFIPFPDGKNDKAVIEHFEEIAKKGDVASFIFEPLIQGTAGMRTYSVETLNALIKIAKQYDVCCIADEVMTGFGRTGKNFACNYLTEEPDIVCVSKGITGGFMALGVTACNQKIMDAFVTKDRMKTFFHGHSYTANPIACAAACASTDLLLSQEQQNNIAQIEEIHKSFIDEIKDEPMVKHINHIGTIISIELKTENESSYFNSNRDFLYDYFMAQDILLRPLGNTIYVIPPYVIEKSTLLELHSSIKKLIKTWNSLRK